MLKCELKKVAVTGVLAGGKSTVCRLLKELGAYVVNADEIVHQLLSIPSALTQKIIELFGADIVINGQIERSRIAKEAFRNPKLLFTLETLLHPAVYEEIEKLYADAKSTNKYTLFVVEIPLLFEVNATSFYDATIAVIADKELCIQRYKLATGRDRDEYERRMSRQLSEEQKSSRATYVIVNNGSIDDLKVATTKIYKTLT